MAVKEVGFLGLGIMGSAMASNLLLQKGIPVCVWNRSPGKTELLVAKGASSAKSPAEVVTKCGITFAMPADPSVALSVALGPEGVLNGITSGKSYVDMSTADVDTSTKISKPQKAVEELKSSVWGDRVRKPHFMKAPASFCERRSCNLAISVSFSSNHQDQEDMNRDIVSRRGWLLLSGFLAGVLPVPTNAHSHSLSILSDLADNTLATNGSSVTNAKGDVGSTESRPKTAEDVKSWYRYRGEGFVLRVPPGYEDVLDYEDEDDDDLYGNRSKEKPFAARFASPDRVEVLSIVIKPVSQLRLSFFETKDITDFGSIKEAAPKFVPPGAKLISARIINSKASRIPRTYYMYEFLVKGMHFMLSTGVSKGNVFVLGASTPQSKWKDNGIRLQLASSTFYLP